MTTKNILSIYCKSDVDWAISEVMGGRPAHLVAIDLQCATDHALNRSDEKRLAAWLESQAEQI